MSAQDRAGTPPGVRAAVPGRPAPRHAARVFARRWHGRAFVPRSEGRTGHPRCLGRRMARRRPEPMAQHRANSRLALQRSQLGGAQKSPVPDRLRARRRRTGDLRKVAIQCRQNAKIQGDPRLLTKERRANVGLVACTLFADGYLARIYDRRQPGPGIQPVSSSP